MTTGVWWSNCWRQWPLVFILIWPPVNQGHLRMRRQWHLFPGGCVVADGVGVELSLVPGPNSQRPHRPQSVGRHHLAGGGAPEPRGSGTFEPFRWGESVQRDCRTRVKAGNIVEVSGLPITEAFQTIRTSESIFQANKPEEWTPRFPHKPKRSNGARDWLIPNRTFKISDGAVALTTRDICCHHTRQIAVIWTLI